MSIAGITNTRVVLANACIFGGAAIFVLTPLWPLVRLAIPGPLHRLGEVLAISGLAIVVGLVGCLLSGAFWIKSRSFAVLSAGTALMLAGGASLVGLLFGDPANFPTSGAWIAAAMTASGYGLFWLQKRFWNSEANVT